ncbi:TolC family protein [bacterium]|nr:TolC family protein [FCB group bacterium]MBL7190441.1 TolC family protein [bacterium]
MKKITKTTFAVLASLFIFSTVSSASPPMRLSLSQALEIAKSENPQVRQARIAVSKAEAQIGEAYASALPSVSVSGLYQRNIILQEMLVEIPGSGSQIFKFQQDNFFNSQIELSQPLYAAGKLGKALQIAKLYRKVSEEQVISTWAEVKLLVTQLYFGAVLAQEWEKTAEETYRQMEAHQRKVEDMYEQGMVSEYDLIRGQVQVTNFYPQVINSQNASKISVERLIIVLGLPKDQQIDLTDDIFEYDVEEYKIDNYFSLAAANRSEIKQLDLQADIFKKLLTIEQHGIRWPNIFLIGGYSYQAQEPDLDVGDYFWMKNLYAGVSLSIPLFDGFRAKHRADQVRADMVLLELNRETLLKNINLEIIEARDKLREALKNINAQVEGVKLAKKGLNIAEVQYENGLATQLEVMDAQIALNQARMNELYARFDAVTARAELEKALAVE